MMKKIAALFALFSLVSTAWAGASALDNDVLKVGTESTYPPYESLSAQGTLEGFDIDLVEAMAEKLGKKVQWVNMAFDSLIPSLLSGKVDMVAAGMSATPERMKRVAFSVPYEESISAFVTKPDGPASLEALKGSVVAVQLGTVQENYARTLESVTVKTFQKYGDCLREVTLGRAESSLMDVPVANRYVESKEFSGKVILSFTQKITTGDKAIALPLKDEALKKALDEALTAMEQDGSLQAMKDKWFK